MALTKHPPGSARELWAIAFPLMLSSFCILTMVFTDRVFLAAYSGEAMSAALTAGTAAWAVCGSLLIFGGMAEVFVAQYNGAKRFDQLGRPVWQMIWFALGSVALFLPLGIWGGPLLFKGSSNSALEAEYFFWFMAFGFSWPLLSAVSAFFVGQGRTRLIFGMSILANGLNILLDWALIFGVPGLFEPMGVKGAAIATNLGNLAQVVIFLAIFLKQKNRLHFGTGKLKLDFPLLRKCVKVATPQATLSFAETFGFTLLYIMVGNVSLDQLFIAGILQSICILFFFACEGVGRGASAVAGNYIGAGEPKQSFKVFRAGLKIHLGFFLFAAIFLVIFPKPLMHLFLGEVSVDRLAGIETAVRGGFLLCLAYLLFDGIRWLISGILSAAGDTLFLLIFGIITVPLALLLPAYWFITRLHHGALTSYLIACFFVGLLAAIDGIRLWSGKWQKIELIKEPTAGTESA